MAKKVLQPSLVAAFRFMIVSLALATFLQNLFDKPLQERLKAVRLPAALS